MGSLRESSCNGEGSGSLRVSSCNREGSGSLRVSATGRGVFMQQGGEWGV